MKTELSNEIITKLIDTVNAGLCFGIGTPEPGKMCVEAAVCYALGLPHGDDPPCVGGAVRYYKIRLNDSNWSSNEARAKGMLGVSIAQLNSIELDQKEFARRIVLKTINTIIADLAKKYLPEKEQEFRTVSDLDKARELCRELRKADDASADDASDAERDKVLTQAANNCLEVLKEMKSPGCEYLYLIGQ